MNFTVQWQQSPIPVLAKPARNRTKSKKEPEPVMQKRLTYFTDDMTKFVTAGDGKVLEALPPGFYNHYYDDDNNDRHFFTAKEPNKSKVLELDADQVEVVQQVDTFWDAAAEYQRLGFQHKRGLLLYGPPGTGKSTTMRHLAQKLVARGGICLSTHHPALIEGAIGAVRARTPNQPIAFVFEDLDGWMHPGRDWESTFTNALDGLGAVEHVLFMATTNYLDKLSDRIKDRPGRFDWLMEIGFPSEETRRRFFLAIDPTLPATDVEELVAQTDKKSIAHLQEALLRRRVFKSSKRLPTHKKAAAAK